MFRAAGFADVQRTTMTGGSVRPHGGSSMTSALLTHRGLRAVTREVDPLRARPARRARWRRVRVAPRRRRTGDRRLRRDGRSRRRTGSARGTRARRRSRAARHGPDPRRRCRSTRTTRRPSRSPRWSPAGPPADAPGSPRSHHRPYAHDAAVAPPTRYTVSALDSHDTWCRAVERALEAIERGELEKVVLSRAVTVDADRPLDRRAVLRGGCSTASRGASSSAAGGLVGATPELLIRRAGAHAESRPLAGTAVGDGASLAGSSKDAAEHRSWVVDSDPERGRQQCATSSRCRRHRASCSSPTLRTSRRRSSVACAHPCLPHRRLRRCCTRRRQWRGHRRPRRWR